MSLILKLLAKYLNKNNQKQDQVLLLHCLDQDLERDIREGRNGIRNRQARPGKEREIR